MKPSLRGLALFGCVAGFQAVEQVLLVRHCVRSMYPTLRGRGDPSFDFSNNYTAHTFPTQEVWNSDGVAHCTKNGIMLSRKYGASLQEKFRLAVPIAVVADNISRCIQTAQQMTSGFGDDASYKGVTRALDPVKNKLCPPSSAENKTKGVSSMIERAQSSKGHLSETWKRRDELKAQLQHLIGRGAAPSISDIPDHIDTDGTYVGGMHVSSQGMLENFILEAGDNISVAWGAFDGVAGRKLLWEHFSPLNVLYNKINHNSVTLASRDGSIAVGILEQLMDPTQGSLVLVGHDTNVDNVAALLGLTWQCGSYADNESPPHIGLLFERHGADASVKVVCAALDDSFGYIPGTALTGIVKQGHDAVTKINIEHSLQDVRDSLDYWGGFECASAPIIEASQSSMII